MELSAPFGHIEARQDPITRDPETMQGTPVFRGTRVPIKTLFDHIENGESLDDFLEGFPTVSRALAVQVLRRAGSCDWPAPDAHGGLAQVNLAALTTA